jgi:two-component system chemotaxis response regulator CheY
MLLEMDGFDVVICPTVQRAENAAGEGVDAFVIDCNLAQGDDGITLLRSIRNGDTSAYAAIPVVMISGDDRRQCEAKEAGATHFLLKPYSPSKLSTILKKLLVDDGA